MRVIVVGGGPAGVSAALHAAELGARVVLIERGQVGGTALNSGPAPIRALARAARLMRDWGSWETFGLRGMRPEIDLAATLANADRVARDAYDRRHIADRIRAAGVELVENAGDVHFLDSATVAGAGHTWQADRFIVAVGGRPGRLAIPGAELGLTYEDVRTLPALPERVCIIGASDTGCQLASILADFGCAVTLVEFAARILPRADHDVSMALERALRDRGIEIMTGAAVGQIEGLPRGARISYQVNGQPRHVDVDVAIFAVGWPSNADRVDVAAAGVATDAGYVMTDQCLRTNVPHIFAVGDLNGNSMFVASAVLEGRVAAENAVLGSERVALHDVVPVGSFTNPEYGSVGLTEEQARGRGHCVIGVARYQDLLRPVADGQPDGFCKLIVETEHRRIVGAHVLGEYSAEVIQMVSTCMAAGMPIDEVAELQFAFPTFTEGVGQAAQMIVRQLGVHSVAQPWASLGEPGA